LQLDGLIFRDQPVKIRRPSDYKPLDLPPELREKKEPLDYSVIPLSSTSSAHALIGSAASSSGAGSMNRIYLGNIPTGITESQLYELVSTFGALKKLDLVRTPEGVPKGFAFVEFADASMTDTAIAGLNNLALGDRTLTASRAKVSGEGMAAPPLPSSFAPTGVPSRVLCLENMVTAEEVMNDNEYKDILEDISAECAKYGALATVDIPRPPVPGAGRVFLQYADVQGATNAANALAGRQFAGRFIVVQYYDEAALRAGILSQ
jgi:splicing factor U2AF subunit